MPPLGATAAFADVATAGLSVREVNSLVESSAGMWTEGAGAAAGAGWGIVTGTLVAVGGFI